jgi:Tir chaperone protein (CesT) family
MNSQILDLIDHFARTLGLEGLAFDRDGIIELEVGDNIAITLGIDQHEHALFLGSEVVPQAAALAPTILRRLLITNARLAVRSGPSFALVPEVGSLLLQQRIPLAGLTYPDFERTWLSFVETHEAATAKLAQLTRTNEGTPPNSDDAELSLEDQQRLFLRI